MIKSINHWSFPEGVDFATALRIAKAKGFPAYEPSFDLTGELSMQSSDADIQALRRQAESEGVLLASLASGLYWQYSYTDNDESVRAKALEITRRQLEAAALLGVDAILVVPGAVGAGFFGKKDVRYDVALERAHEAIASLLPHAKACGVVIGVENVWNNFLVSPVEMRDFIDALESNYVGCYFDVGNVVRTGLPEQWIELLGKRIVRIHMKDYRRSVGTLDGFVDLCAGDVDFPKVMAALRAVGYDSFLTAEQLGLGGSLPMNVLDRTSVAMDAILQC